MLYNEGTQGAYSMIFGMLIHSVTHTNTEYKLVKLKIQVKV
jgi:hypothetical protein